MLMDTDHTDWRNESGLDVTSFYKKKFSFFRTTCSDGEIVLFKIYYKKYNNWNSSFRDYNNGHVDFVENITEAEYLTRKLADNL